MAQGVQAGVFGLDDRLAVLIHCRLPRLVQRGRRDACGDQGRDEAARHDIGVVLDQAAVRREYETRLALGTSQFPVLERVDDDRRQRDDPLAGRRLRRPDGAVAIGALANMDLRLAQVDVGPA